MNVFHFPARRMTAVILSLTLLLCGCGSSSAGKRESLATSVLSPFGDSTPDPAGGDAERPSIEEELLGSSDFTPSVTAAPAAQDSGFKPASGDVGDFERYEIPCVLAVNEDFTCPAIIEKDFSQPSKGTLTVIQYDVKPVSEDMIEFGAKNGADFNGYEMRVATTQIDFLDRDTDGKNVSIWRLTSDYYDVEAPENGVWHKDHLDRDFLEYKVNYQGREQSVYFWIRSGWTGYDAYCEYKEDAIYFVPAGYDGVVRGFINPSMTEKDLRKNHPDGDVLLFRLN